MADESGKTIRVPVASIKAGNTLRTIIISRPEGIKALYDVTEKSIVSYLFEKSKSWTPESSQEWVAIRKRRIVKEFKEITVDQEKDFIKLSAEYADGVIESFEPSYGEPFIVTNDMVIEQEADMQTEDKAKDTKKDSTFCPNCGWAGEGKVGADCPDCGSKTRRRGKPESGGDRSDGDDKGCASDGGKKPRKEKSESADKNFDDSLEIIKTDKARQLVYGVFLWPDKADTDGDIISADDIEMVAHKFLVEYRAIDEMHKKEKLDAEIVESFISWSDNLEYYGKILKRGAWAGAIHVNDKGVWDKIEKGQYKGFSVRISGQREPVGEGIEEGVNG